VIRFVLDTNAVSMAFDAVEPISSRILAQPPGSVGTTAVSLEESLSGWYTYLRRATTPEGVERAFDELIRTTLGYGRLPILRLSANAERAADALVRMKLNVKKNDLRIAAIALEAGATVVTANVRDFARVPGLAVEDWTRPATESPVSGGEPA
jgi:tRNA(fMet)-specific endonuclease VapC